MMDLAYSQTSIPIPRILKRITYRGGNFLFMEYVDGSDLYQVWPTLSLWRRIQVAWTLRGYVHQLRTIELPSKVIPGPFDGTGTPLVCEGHHFTEGGSGPFASYTAMADWYNGRSRLTYVLRNPSITDLSMIPPLTSFFDDSMPLVFTHGDISPTNVRIAKDGSVWLLDWERAGAYPQWFEYANMMAYRHKVHFTEEYDAVVWPRGWQWLVPLVAGRYKKQLSFLQRSAVGIAHYKFEGFD
ncbi:hypothetical protein H0H93_014805 [Arthromyces matolae]|nr:hypothetical protein H0H93_014805 [Arthromyces matolae]